MSVVKLTEDQARDAIGRFAGGAEAQARNTGRHPIAPHDGKRSVGTHVSGKGLFAAVLGAATGAASAIIRGSRR